MVGKIFALGAAALAGALVVYVNNEVRKEYDACVDENNMLRDFIQNHDFYEKIEASSVQKSSLVKESTGSGCDVYTDEKSGFKILNYAKRNA